MQSALILMTILGCDDTATQCHYVETVDRQWASIQICDTAAEAEIGRFSDIEYPVVVAFCETSEKAGSASVAAVEDAPGAETRIDDGATVASAAPDSAVDGDETPPQQPETGRIARMVGLVKDALPAADGVKSLAAKPVRFASDGYAWVAQRFER